MIKLYHSLVLFKYMSLFQYDFWFTAFGKTSAKAVASSARTALGALGAREGGKQRGWKSLNQHVLDGDLFWTYLFSFTWEKYGEINLYTDNIVTNTAIN